MHRVAVELSGNRHRLESDLDQSSEPTPERHSPDVSTACLPVGSDDWRNVDVPTFFHVVVNEVLQQELIDLWPLTSTSDRPNVVGKESERPMAGLS